MLLPIKICNRKTSIFPCSLIQTGDLVSSVRLLSFLLRVQLLCLILLPKSHGALRFSEQSCSDLVPRNADLYSQDPPSDFAQFFGIDTWSGSRGRYRQRQTSKIKRSGNVQYGEEPPFKIQVTGRRYRRNSDLIGSHSYKN
jgi:hypothetical protein